MKKCGLMVSVALFLTAALLAAAPAQERRLGKVRVGGGSASGAQRAVGAATGGIFDEKHGLDAETISIPGSSLALQAMLAGELPIIQLGGAASIQANFSGADTVIVAPIVRRFLFSIFARP